MKAVWYEGIVRDMKRVSDTKLEFSMEVVHDDQFTFEPGQFVTMDLPIGEKRRQRWRSYSIANIPNQDNILSFGIGHLDEGLASAYFFNTMKIGDSIKFKGSDGAFVLPKNLDRPIVMIATGTGVVPFVSMLRYIKAHNLEFESIHLIYGCRYEKDVLYREELEILEAEDKRFNLDIVLSREPDFIGNQGYVHTIYQEKFEDKKDDILYLLCGWSAMIDEAMVNLFPKVANPTQQIKYELYG